MTRAALLCPGSSIAGYPGRDGFDLVIGVNRAALMVPVDAWACMDWPLLQKSREQVIARCGRAPVRRPRI